MKKIGLSLLAAMVSFYVHAQENMTPQEMYVTKKITAFMQQNNVPGTAVELYVEGKPYEYYFGYADDEKKTPVMNKTIFELGSVSKIMTSILLAQEVDWAKMGFTDGVNKYVKDLPENFSNIRLQDLAAYTSGLPFTAPKNITDKDALKEYLGTHQSQIHPGRQWKYSNLGMALLGIALESSADSDFGDLYQRHILNPLKMVNGVTIPAVYNKYYAQGHDKNGSPVPPVQAGMYTPAYGIKASAVDMQRFLSAAIGLPGTPPRVFYPMRMTQAVYVKMANEYQGLGWIIHKIGKSDIRNLLNTNDYHAQGPAAIQEVYERAMFGGEALIDKTGTTDGFKAYIAVIPSKQSGIVILANKNVSHEAIVRTARNILFKTTGLI